MANKKKAMLAMIVAFLMVFAMSGFTLSYADEGQDNSGTAPEEASEDASQDGSLNEDPNDGSQGADDQSAGENGTEENSDAAETNDAEGTDEAQGTDDAQGTEENDESNTEEDAASGDSEQDTSEDILVGDPIAPCAIKIVKLGTFGTAGEEPEYKGAGAKFRLYRTEEAALAMSTKEEDIVVLVNGMLAEGVTDENGELIFEVGEAGEYWVKEIEAPPIGTPGEWILNENAFKVVASMEGVTITVVNDVYPLFPDTCGYGAVYVPSTGTCSDLTESQIQELKDAGIIPSSQGETQGEAQAEKQSETQAETPKQEAKATSVPKTGDNEEVMAYMGILALAAGISLALGRCKKNLDK